MIDELYINGELVDLPEGATIGLDYESTDIGELENRKGNKSSSIKIPFTANNLRLFGYSSIPESSSTLPYTSLTCKYKKYGLQIINDGRIIIDEIEQDGFSCNIYWGSFDFMTKIKEGNINDIDYTDLEEDWTMGSILASASDTSGLTYPVMDWNSDSPNTFLGTSILEVKSYQMFPQIFEKTIFDRIISDAGFSYTFPASIASNFANKLIPLTGIKANDYLRSLLAVEYESDNNHLVAIAETVDWEDRITDYYQLMYDFKNYTIPIDGRYTFTTEVNFSFLESVPPGVGAIKAEIHLRITNGTETRSTYVLITAFEVGSRTLTLTANCVAGEYVHVDLIPGAHGDFTFLSGTFTVTDVQVEKTKYLYWYPIAENLPIIKKSDFVKNIMQRYGLFVFQSDTVLTFYRLDDILANKDKAISLDSAIVTNKRLFENKRFAISGFSQKNYFKYKPDKTVFGNYDSYLSCNNTNIEPEKTIYESPFAGSDDSIRITGYRLANIPRLTLNVWKTETEPKVLSSWQSIETLTITDDVTPKTTALWNVAVFDDNVNTDSLDFTDVLTTNYSILTQILTDPVEIKVMVDWGVLDFIKIDPTIPYFLWNEYYLLKKVSNFKRDELTELELIRI